MRIRVGIVAALAAALLTASCGSSEPDGNQPSSTSAPAASQQAKPTPGAQVSANGLTVQVTGSCADAGGFRLKSSGFTPNGEYRTDAAFPNGRAYTYLLNGGRGRADATGATPGWTWDCIDGPGGRPDTPGVYTITITDLTTGNSVQTSLEVKYE